MMNLHLVLMVLGAAFLLVPRRVFELDGIGYVKGIHYSLKIIGGCFILSAAVSLYLRR